MAFSWKLYGDGKTPPLGEAVAPDERLSWPLTIGIGAQHVVAMFGATFVFPLVMGLDPNLAIMMSGIATIIFLLIVNGKIPSYLGTSASFVGGVVAIRAQGGDSSDVVGSILIAGVVLALVGLLIHFAGVRFLHAILPPAVTGAVVLLIGFNLAPVVAGIYWPQDQWVALATMTFVIVASLLFRGFWSRIAILLGLIFGFLLSWLLDVTAGPITSVLGGATEATTHDRLNLSRPVRRQLVRAAHLHRPELLAELLAARAARRHRAGRGEHRARQGGRGDDQARPRPVHGPRDHRRRRRHRRSPRRSVARRRPRTRRTSASWPPPASTRRRRTTWPRSWRSCSGLCPKFGALIFAIPGGVLGGITVVLYGMIGLLGAKIWKENRVDFANPINLVPLAAGIIIAIGDVTLVFTDTFSLGGIALGTIVAVGRLARRPRPGAGGDEGGAAARGSAPRRPATTFGHVHGAEEHARPVVGRRGRPSRRHRRAHTTERARTTGETSSVPLRRPRHPRRGPRGPLRRG